MPRTKITMKRATVHVNDKPLHHLQTEIDNAMKLEGLNAAEGILALLAYAMHQAAWLDASQRSWEAYADIRCDGVFDQWKGGTIRTIMTVGCRIEATRQRTHDIWADHLTYADSTPPVLPEPVLTVFEEQEAAAQRP